MIGVTTVSIYSSLRQRIKGIFDYKNRRHIPRALASMRRPSVNI
jgi:hypothetical protein